MLEPLLIYADPYGREVDTVPKFSGDFVVGADRNNFSLDVPKGLGIDEDWYLIVDGTEFGGIVDEVELDTTKKYLTASGRTWQGMWQENAIEPDPGQSHLVLTGDLNDVIGALITRLDLQDRMTRPKEAAGISVSGYQIRYRYGYEALLEMCASVGAKPRFRYDGRTRKCEVGAVARADYTDDGTDGDVCDVKLRRRRLTNHWLGLGKGEGANRVVVNLYADRDGNKSTTQKLFGVRHRMEIYDSPSAEEDDLVEAIEKRIRETQKKMFEVSLKNATTGDYDIGDIVGGRSSELGVYVTTSVAQKTAKVTSSGITCTTKTALEA